MGSETNKTTPAFEKDRKKKLEIRLRFIKFIGFEEQKSMKICRKSIETKGDSFSKKLYIYILRSGVDIVKLIDRTHSLATHLKTCLNSLYVS